MTQYVIFNADTLCVHGFVDADELPVMDGWQLAEVAEAVPHYPEAPFAGAVLTWTGALTWRDDRLLPAAISIAIAKTYADIDAVVREAVGERTKEYERREAAARSFVASGYADPVPERVAVWAQYNPTMQQQGARWAADNIISRADALIARQDAMGDQRFRSQYAMRAATTNAELDAAVVAWNSFIAQTRAQLGL